MHLDYCDVEWFALEMNRDHSVIFETASKCCILDSLVDYDGYSMSMFTLAISYLITSNLPSFMELTFQVPMQYFSLQHQTLLPSPVTSTTGSCFCFGPVSSFFLQLFLHWPPVVYWAPTDLGSSSFSVLSFCLFVLFMGFSRQEYWSSLPFPSPVVCHSLLQ